MKKPDSWKDLPWSILKALIDQHMELDLESYSYENCRGEALDDISRGLPTQENERRLEAMFESVTEQELSEILEKQIEYQERVLQGLKSYREQSMETLIEEAPLNTELYTIVRQVDGKVLTPFYLYKEVAVEVCQKRNSQDSCGYLMEPVMAEIISGNRCILGDIVYSLVVTTLKEYVVKGAFSKLTDQEVEALGLTRPPEEA